MAIRKRERRSIFDMIDDYFGNLEHWAEDFEDALVEKPSWDLKRRTMEPLRNMIVTPSEVVVTVDLPFTEPKTITVKPVNEKSIEISAEMRRKIKFEDLGVTHRQGEFHTFYCRTRIPVPVDMDKLRFAAKKGILDIHIPRHREK